MEKSELTLTTSDLILCANLLLADARSYENMLRDGATHPVLEERANDRRTLARRLIAEVDRRGLAHPPKGA